MHIKFIATTATMLLVAAMAMADELPDNARVEWYDTPAGATILLDFGTKCMPNAYAEFEKRRDFAKELEQALGEEFPDPKSIGNDDPRFPAYNKVNGKFRNALSEMILQRNAICSHWIAYKFGVESAADLAKVDASMLELGKDLWNDPKKYDRPELTTLEGEVVEFAAKYAPESAAVYQKMATEYEWLDKLLADVIRQKAALGYNFCDDVLCAALSKRTDLAGKANALSMKIQTWYYDHRMMEKTSEDVAKCDHVAAFVLKSFMDEVVSAGPYRKNSKQLAETPARISYSTQGEDYIGTSVQTYTDGAETYFKITVSVANHETLPPIPKDIVFVQDASMSMGEERLHFCRDAVSSCLTKLLPSDRFNVVAFGSDTQFCFNGWVPVNDVNVEQAKKFVLSIRSNGVNDIIKSLQAVLQLPRDAKRPMIIIFISDGGNATTDITESSRIIGELSKLNDNVSFFAIGTHKRANQYFLDLLSSCNRGSSRIVDSGRWDIPTQIEAVVDSVALPVLGHISVTPTSESHADIFPRPPANLYVSKNLELYGNCPADRSDLVLHFCGESGSTGNDVNFQMRIDIEKAEKGSLNIKSEWARRKIHYLIGEYARNPSDKTKQEILMLSSSASIPVPYRTKVWR